MVFHPFAAAPTESPVRNGISTIPALKLSKIPIEDEQAMYAMGYKAVPLRQGKRMPTERICMR
jgi:hypothetical protein